MTSPVDHDASLPHEAYLTAIASLENVGPATFRWLLSHGSPKRVWQRLGSARLAPGPGARITSAQIERWQTQSRELDPAALWARCISLGIGVVSLGAAGYPARLADDPDPPVILFQRGDPGRVASRRVAIVGTRRATAYGREVAYELARGLTAAGVSVVSGLALGVDGAAHAGALAAVQDTVCQATGPRGPLAVVGASLDSPCPRANLALADRVARDGVVYSEVPPGTPSAPWRYPVRNRILAALCDVLVVVESDANGGSMHTVREALDRDRVIMAVPGPITARSARGTNQLLRDGAAPCLGIDDVLLELGIAADQSGCVAPQTDPRVGTEAGLVAGPDRFASAVGFRPSEVQQRVLEQLGWRPVTVERLGESCGLSPRELAVVTAELESAGVIRRTGSWVERRA